MPELVGDDIKKLPNHRIDRCDARRRRFLWRALPDLIQVLIAKTDRRTQVPGIRSAIAPNRPHCQVDRQSKRTEEPLDLLEGLALLDVSVDALMPWILAAPRTRIVCDWASVPRSTMPAGRSIGRLPIGTRAQSGPQWRPQRPGANAIVRGPLRITCDEADGTPIQILADPSPASDGSAAAVADLRRPIVGGLVAGRYRAFSRRRTSRPSSNPRGRACPRTGR